jgi:putative intracellular protease/amidase
MKVQVLALDGFDELDALAPFEVFRHAGRISDVDVTLVTATRPADRHRRQRRTSDRPVGVGAGASRRARRSRRQRHTTGAGSPRGAEIEYERRGSVWQRSAVAAT